MMKNLFAAIFLLLFQLIIPAQEKISAAEALRIGLANNFDVIAASSVAAADSVRNSAGQAGMLPTVALNGTYSFNHLDGIHQKFSNGNEIISGNSLSSNLGAAVVLNWTLFDGTKMFITRNKLSQLQARSNYAFRDEVQQAAENILLSYYDVSRRKQLVRYTSEIIRLNEERTALAEKRLGSGLGPKTDFLQSKIDGNIQKENLILREEELTSAKRKLNELLARDVKSDFEISDSITNEMLANRAQIEQQVLSNNPGLMAMRLQAEVSLLSLREARTAYLPRLAATAGYNFSHSQNTAGFSLLNESYGLQGGLTLSVPLYQAGSARRATQLARIDLRTAQNEVSRISLQASLQLYEALAQYDSRMKILELEKENEMLARENIRIALDRLSNGLGTAIEVKEAEATLSLVLTRIANSRYEAKAAEIRVKRLAAQF